MRSFVSEKLFPRAILRKITSPKNSTTDVVRKKETSLTSARKSLTRSPSLPAESACTYARERTRAEIRGCALLPPCVLITLARSLARARALAHVSHVREYGTLFHSRLFLLIILIAHVYGTRAARLAGWLASAARRENPARHARDVIITEIDIIYVAVERCFFVPVVRLG